jgi:hypothetical protein
MAVERAITESAPEIVRIDVVEPTQQPPPKVAVAITTKPVFEECPAEMVGT